MKLTKNDMAMLALATKHIKKVRAKFTKTTANHILDALAPAVEAIRVETLAGRDGREVLITISECLVETDNISTLLTYKTKTKQQQSERK